MWRLASARFRVGQAGGTTRRLVDGTRRDGEADRDRPGGGPRGFQMANDSVGMDGRAVQAVGLVLLIVTIASAALAIWSIAVRPAHVPNGLSVAGLDEAGTTDAVGVSGEGLSLGALDSWVADVQTVGGLKDLSAHIGKEVVVVADSSRLVNDVAFWVGTAPYGILVVADPEVRSGLPPTFGRTSLPHPPPDVVTLVGTVEPVPSAEAAYSWALTRRGVEALAERGVYVRLHEVLAAVPGLSDPASTAGNVEEFGRETAPPPGDEVDSFVPPPLP